MIDGLSELKTACARGAELSDKARIAAGETHWFAGHPLPAAPGTIALAQRDTLKLVFCEEDILEAHKWDERFLVKVRAGADMLISMEQVVKAGASGCCGGETDQTHEGAIARRVSDIPNPWDYDVTVSSWGTGCWWRVECFTITTPLLGPIKVCIPTHVLC